jgi:NitT/TauT family transport system permease protein/taurine transport system permease protein
VLAVGSLILAFPIWQFLSTVLFNPFSSAATEVIRTASMLMSGEILGDGDQHDPCVTGLDTGSPPESSPACCSAASSSCMICLTHHQGAALLSDRQIPIAVIWFGIGELSKYFLIFWGTFFIVVINTTAGVWRAPIARQRAAQCLGANQLQIFVLVVVPSAVPYIVTGMRVAMASSFMSIIPAEILAADSGIGYLLQKSSMLLQTNRIFVALLTICVLGFIVDRIFRFFVDRVLARYMSFVSQT